MNTNKFLVIDFEFTCFDLETVVSEEYFPEVIEMGAVLFNPKTSCCEKTMRTFVKPVKNVCLSQYCKNLTTIKQNQVNSGMELRDMLNLLTSLYDNNTYFCSWGDLDWYGLKKQCTEENVSFPFFFGKYIDLSNQYKMFYNLDKPPSLYYALRRWDLEFTGTPHRALYDAINTVKIVQNMISEGWHNK